MPETGPTDPADAAMSPEETRDELERLRRRLEREPLSAEQGDYAGAAYNSATSLLAIIDDVLDFAKAEAGRIELEAVPLDLHPPIEGVIETIAPGVARSIEAACAEKDHDAATRGVANLPVEFVAAEAQLLQGRFADLGEPTPKPA